MTSTKLAAMVEDYVSGMSLRQCAAKHVCARSTVILALEKAGFERRAAGRGNSVKTKIMPRFTGFDQLVVRQLWTGQCDWRGDAYLIARANILGIAA